MTANSDSVGILLKTLTDVLEIELLKKQQEELNAYDNIVKQLKDVVNLAKTSQ